MSTARPFAYNTGSTISGTIQLGDLAIGVDPLDYPGGVGGVRWWNGPDEDLGYIICRPNLNGNQPNPDNDPAYIRFLRSKLKTEESFVNLTNVVFGQSFTNGNDCKSYLDLNGYWNSWIITSPTPTPTNTVTPTNSLTPTPTPTPLSNLIIYLDSGNITSYPTTGTTWYDLVGTQNNATLINSPTFSSNYDGILQFDDVSLEYGTIPNIGNLSQWTVEVWFRLSTSLTGKISSIISNQFDLVNKLNFSIGTNNQPSNANLAVGFFNGAWRTTTGFVPAVNTWYQVVGTYDGSILRQYVNGVASGGTLNYVGTPQSGGEIRLMRRWDDSLTSGNLIDGDLAIVKIYNNAISSTEVLQNYNDTYTRFIETTPTPTLTATPTPTPTITQTPTLTPTLTPTPTNTPLPVYGIQVNVLNEASGVTQNFKIKYSSNSGSTWDDWITNVGGYPSYNSYAGLQSYSGGSIWIGFVDISDNNLAYGSGILSGDYSSLCGILTPYKIDNITANTQTYINMKVELGSYVLCPLPSPTPTVTPTKTTTPTVTPTNTLTPTPTPSSAGGGIVSDSLFMELDASNYTSGTWSDETGNGNNATINGATWSSTDGGIFDLDGISNTISIPHVSNLSLNTTTQRTIQVWVKFDSLPGSGQQVPVFGKLSSSYAFDGYWGGLFSNTGTVRCTTNGSSIQRISTSTLTVSINTWYLMTFMSQITSTSNTTKVYINETEYITATHGTDGYTESNPLYLGYIGSGVGSLYLNGKIGACYFYTKGLNTTEIGQNFNATKTRYGL